MPDRSSSLAVVGGAVGPAGFIGAWAVGSGSARGYSPVDDAISELAARGAPTWPLLTAGLIVYALGLAGVALAVRDRAPAMALAAGLNAVASLGVAATRLDHSAWIDRAHGVSALVGYLTLLAIPPLARVAGTVDPSTWLARMALPATVVGAVALGLSVLDSASNGWWQRVGLTTVDVWVIVWSLRSFRAGPHLVVGEQIAR